MAAPTNTADVKKTLANSEPSTHGPSRHVALRSLTVAFGGKADSGRSSAPAHFFSGYILLPSHRPVR